jgi:hypothetical protein
VQIPVSDPMMVVPVMAAVTEHIGFGVTAFEAQLPPGPTAAVMTGSSQEPAIPSNVGPKASNRLSGVKCN